MASETADQLGQIAQSGVDPATGSYLSSAQRKAVFRRSLIKSSKVFAKPGAIVKVGPTPLVRITPQQLAITKQSTEEDRTQTISLQNIISQINALRNQVLKLSNNFAQLSRMVLQTAEIEEQNEKMRYLLSRRQMEKERKREKENVIEKALSNVLLEPVKRVASTAQNALLRLLNFFSILFVGWLTNQSLELIKANSEGNVAKVKEITGQIVKNVGIVLGTLGALQLAMTAIPAALGAIVGTITAFIGKKIVKGFFEWVKKNLWDKVFPPKPKPPTPPGVTPPGVTPPRAPKLTTAQFLEELRRRTGQKIGLPYKTTLNPEQLSEFDDLMRIVRQQRKVLEKAGKKADFGDLLKQAQTQLFGEPLTSPKVNIPGGILDEGLMNKLPGWMKNKKLRMGGNLLVTIASMLGMGYLTEQFEKWSYEQATNWVKSMYPYLNEEQQRKVLENYAKDIAVLIDSSEGVGGAMTEISRWVSGLPSISTDISVKQQLLEDLISDYSKRYNKDPEKVAKEVSDLIQGTLNQIQKVKPKEGGVGGPDLPESMLLDQIPLDNGRNDSYALPLPLDSIIRPTPKVGDYVGGMPDQKPQLVYMSSGGSKPKIDAPLKSGSSTQVPFISSSNPNNMYTLYSQINYNVVM